MFAHRSHRNQSRSWIYRGRTATTDNGVISVSERNLLWWYSTPHGPCAWKRILPRILPRYGSLSFSVPFRQGCRKRIVIGVPSVRGSTIENLLRSFLTTVRTDGLGRLSFVVMRRYIDTIPDQCDCAVYSMAPPVSLFSFVYVDYQIMTHRKPSQRAHTS